MSASLPRKLAVTSVQRTCPAGCHPVHWVPSELLCSPQQRQGPRTCPTDVARAAVAVWGTICSPAPGGGSGLCFLPPAIVAICFPASCLLMFSCFKTAMSQIGSRLRKKKSVWEGSSKWPPGILLWRLWRGRDSTRRAGQAVSQVCALRVCAARWPSRLAHVCVRPSVDAQARVKVACHPQSMAHGSGCVWNSEGSRSRWREQAWFERFPSLLSAQYGLTWAIAPCKRVLMPVQTLRRMGCRDKWSACRCVCREGSP